MEYKIYEVKTESFIDRAYEFHTAAKKGNAARAVVFYRSDEFPENFFAVHLSGILDMDNEGNELVGVDRVHREAVLTTVGSIIQDFLRRYPTAILHCIGIKPPLARLHQLAIGSIYDKMGDDYVAYGRNSGEWGIVNKHSRYKEHLFFKKHCETVPATVENDPEVNHSSPKQTKQITKYRSDPERRAKQEAFFECVIKLGIPEDLKRRLPPTNEKLDRMELERYHIEEKDGGHEYQFYSEGPWGRIKKVVRFQPYPAMGRNVYNLAFGNIDEATGGLDNQVISDNDDDEKINEDVEVLG